MSTRGSDNCEYPNIMMQNMARPTGLPRGNETRRRLPKVPARLITKTDTRVSRALDNVLEPPKQHLESQAVEMCHISWCSIFPSHCTDVEWKIGLICCSPGWIPYGLILVRTFKIRARQQVILVK